MATGSRARDDAAPRNIVPIHVDYISLIKRLRNINQETVDKLYEDISSHGLLQPIGVQQSKDGPSKFVVIYGAHRLLAFKKGWALAERLIEERTDKDPEARKMAQMFQTIPAIVYDRAMPNDYAQLKEISENLIRQNLTKNEQAHHLTQYTLLIKKLRLVVPADENRSKTQKNESKQRDGQDVQHVPTATEKATADLGVSVKTLHRAHEHVNALASAVARDKGLKPPVRITPETEPSDAAEHTLRLAGMAVAEKQKAAKAGEDPRKVFPVTRQPEEQVTVRIDITDPEQLLGWFSDRLADAQKPLSMAYLRKLHQGLGKLIAEKGAVS